MDNAATSLDQFNDIIKLGSECGIHHWDYVTVQETKFIVDKTVSFPKEFKNKWVHIEYHTDDKICITVSKDYAWNGPKLKSGVISSNLIASLLIDVLYQFALEIANMWHVKKSTVYNFADEAFLETMLKTSKNKIIAYICYYGVKWIGLGFLKVVKWIM